MITTITTTIIKISTTITIIIIIIIINVIIININKQALFVTSLLKGNKIKLVRRTIENTDG